VYDERIHFDTYASDCGGTTPNLLSVASRQEVVKNWRLEQANMKNNFLIPQRIVNNIIDMQNVQRITEVFPFPPEAMAHCEHIFNIMMVASKRFNSDILHEALAQFQFKDNIVFNELACAMLLYGNSILSSDVNHHIMNFTQSTLQDQRELPFVTWGACGYMFTLYVDADGRVHVRPVPLTHDIHTSFNDSFVRFAPLPCDQDITFPVQDMSTICQYGLAMEKNARGTDSVSFTKSVHMKDTSELLGFWPFPVVHYPVLVVVKQYMWSVQVSGSKRLFVASNEYFRQMHWETFLVERVKDEWFVETYKELSDLFDQKISEYQTEVTEDEAQFAFLFAIRENQSSASAKGFWIVFFDSTRQSLYFPTVQSLRAQLQNHSLEDRNVNSPSRIRMGGNFLMAENIDQTLVEIEKLEEGNLMANFHALDKYTFSSDTSSWNPLFIPMGSSTVKCPLKWGLVVEHNNGKFLHQGNYNIDVTSRDQAYAVAVDYINMSRCMVTEGSELWLKLTPALYKSILTQAEEQVMKIMLPVSSQLHEQMQECGEACQRYLRCFYVLGGSHGDKHFIENSIALFITIAGKGSPMGHKTSQDDTANYESLVNQHIDTQQCQFLRFRLSFEEHDANEVLSIQKDDSLPFYKYMKMDYVSRR